MPPTTRTPSKPCVVCGVTFAPYQARQTTCSRACYDRTEQRRARNRRHDQDRERVPRPMVGDRRASVLRSRLKQKYGLTPEQLAQMVADQDGRCAICGEPPNGNGRANSRLNVDHDHDTSEIRGLLCARCNRGIGLFGDDPNLLLQAAAYLITHSPEAALRHA